MIIAKKFNKISKRRGKKRPTIAIARKILVAIYHMLLTGEVWNPSNETSDKDRLKYTKNNLKQLFSLCFTSEDILEFVCQNAI